MKIKIHPPQAIHEMGKRSNQEDCILPLIGEATADDRLFVLCDGMGGHERGEVASAAICEGISAYFNERISSDEVLTDEQLQAALESAYEVLDTKDNGAFRKAGTTMTLLYFHRGGCTAAHIGDSRIYHVRPSSHTILYMSRDHSLVFELYQMGEISYSEMKTHPRKNQVSRAMIPGKDNRQEADIVHITDIRPDDYFFICSDGVLEHLEDEDLVELLASDDSDEQKCRKLVEMTANNDDNHSAYMIHVEDVAAEDVDADLLNDEQTVRFNAINIHPVLNVQPDNSIEIVNPSPNKPLSKPKRAKVLRGKCDNYCWLAILSLVLLFVIVLMGYIIYKIR